MNMLFEEKLATLREMINESIHVRDAFRVYLEAKTGVQSPKTVRWYESKLDPLVDYLEEREIMIQDVTVYHLRSWRKTLSTRTLSPETLRGYVRAARAFFAWLAREGLLREDPAERLEMPERSKAPRRGISEEDRDKIIEAARDNPRDYALVLFLAATMCRVGGICNLTTSDIDFTQRRAVVREKGSKSRWVYYDWRTAQALSDYLDRFRPDVPGCQAVFMGLKRGGKRAGWHGLTPSGVYQVIKRLAGKASVTERWNPHNWRHGGVRGASKRGMPLKALSQILGHSSESVTADIYGVMDDDALQMLYDRYNWLVR